MKTHPLLDRGFRSVSVEEAALLVAIYGRVRADIPPYDTEVRYIQRVEDIKTLNRVHGPDLALMVEEESE